MYHNCLQIDKNFPFFIQVCAPLRQDI